MAASRSLFSRSYPVLPERQNLDARGMDRFDLPSFN